MGNMIQRIKKDKKGFTLVELLVVLVILAILAAAIIPSMMGFIDKARQESAAAECRSVILAADVEMNELYGIGTLPAAVPEGGALTQAATADQLAAIVEIADLSGTIGSVTYQQTADGHWFVGGATYTTSRGTAYTYTATTAADGTWAEND